ncbi:MAG: metallophosphoesterase [Kiritimatiellia bacterium]|nr:metallophosphoesterase [Kiritimatiellia bacterium]
MTKKMLLMWLVSLTFSWVFLTPAALAQAGDKTLSHAPEGSFSIVVIPDTQRYRERDTKIQSDSTNRLANPVFDAHTRWIANNLKSQRIVFVSHSGDIVDKNNTDQWQVARQCMDRLHGRVPYGISVGNHDMTGKGNSALFQKYFSADRFKSFDWYGGTFPVDPERPNASGNNANSYQRFSGEGLNFVILHLECNAPDEVLRWADRIFEEYTDRWAIVTTHMDLGVLEHPTTARGYFDDPKGRMRWAKRHGSRGNSPQQMWDKCFRKPKNLLIIFSGDQSRVTAMYLKSTGDHGNTVHALMSDYTSSGPLRIYRFLPAKSEIQVITYDTTRDKLINETRTVPGRENHQFMIHQDLTLEAPASSKRTQSP